VTLDPKDLRAVAAVCKGIQVSLARRVTRARGTSVKMAILEFKATQVFKATLELVSRAIPGKVLAQKVIRERREIPGLPDFLEMLATPVFKVIPELGNRGTPVLKG
jgi:hypothetical protein